MLIIYYFKYLCGCRGVGAASLRVVPMAFVSFLTYEVRLIPLTATAHDMRYQQERAFTLQLAALQRCLLCSLQ